MIIRSELMSTRLKIGIDSIRWYFLDVPTMIFLTFPITSRTSRFLAAVWGSNCVRAAISLILRALFSWARADIILYVYRSCYYCLTTGSLTTNKGIYFCAEVSALIIKWVPYLFHRSSTDFFLKMDKISGN